MARNRNNKKSRHEDTDFLKTVSSDRAARAEGPKKKSWTHHDILNIQPMTPRQKDMFQLYLQGSQVVAYGSAGTGKTFLAMYLALRDIIDKSTPQNGLIIVRSAVASREVGHLPGDLNEKMAQFEVPYQNICHELFGKPSTYENMKEAGLVEFVSTSHIRGITWDDKIVVVDESQNLTWHEINSVMTRVGRNTRVIFAGDIVQSDLNHRKNDVSGMARLLRTADRMKEFTSVKFTTDDIVRSALVKSWIIATEQTED